MSQPFQVIEDIVGNSGIPQQSFQNPSYNQQGNPAYGLQMPQPLKSAQSLNTSYMAPQNTMNSFDHFGGSNNIHSSAYQSSAIRGRVASPHIYQWDAGQLQTNVEQQKKQLAVQSGMKLGDKRPPPVDHFSFDPKQSIRNAVADVYKAHMLKTHQMGGWSIYKCPVENLVGGNFKFIVAIVPQHEYVPLGSYFSLRSLPWVSFQTRNTENPAAEFGQQRPAAVHYTVPTDSSNPLYDKIHHVVEQKDKHLYAATTFPVKVEVLKQKQGDMAANSSTLMSALESFRCVLTLN
jgi:hypothetical protein